jgi:hypothetical protein
MDTQSYKAGAGGARLLQCRLPRTNGYAGSYARTAGSPPHRDPDGRVLGGRALNFRDNMVLISPFTSARPTHTFLSRPFSVPNYFAHALVLPLVVRICTYLVLATALSHLRARFAFVPARHDLDFRKPQLPHRISAKIHNPQFQIPAFREHFRKEHTWSRT